MRGGVVICFHVWSKGDVPVCRKCRCEGEAWYDGLYCGISRRRGVTDTDLRTIYQAL